MDIRIDNTYTLKGKGEMKFSIYETRTTKDKFVTKKGKKIRVPLEEGEEGITTEELVSANLSLEDCIRKLVAIKVKKDESVVSLEEFLTNYIKEKEQFETAIENVKNILNK